MRPIGRRTLSALPLASLIACGVLLVAPGPANATFNGLPWSSIPEISVAVLFVVGTLSRRWRRRASQHLDRHPRSAWAAVALIVVLSALKVAAALTSPGAGALSGCYSGVQSQASTNTCEVSFENPWKFESVTRFDADIDFTPIAEKDPWYPGSTWDLGFVNDLEFNIRPSDSDSFDLRRFPFQAVWKGEADSSGRISVRYVGQVEIHIGSAVEQLAPNYQQVTTLAIDIPPGTHEIELRYVFDSPVRFGEIPPGPYATLQLSGLTPTGPAWPVGLVALLVDITAGILAVAMLVVTASLLRQSSRRSALIATFGLGTVVVTELLVSSDLAPESIRGQVSATVVVATSLVVGLILFQPARTLSVGLPVVALTAVFETLRNVGHLTEVTFRSRGDDWMTYQAFARTMLEGDPLRGAADVFYYQPGFRYVLYALRLLLGDGDALVAMAQVVGFGLIAVLFGAVAAARASSRSSRTIIAIAVGSTMTFGLTGWFVDKAHDGLSEIPAWIALIGLGVLLAQRRSSQNLVPVALLAAAAALLRPNQLPAMAALLAAVIVLEIRRSGRAAFRSVTVAGGLFMGLLLLPLAHNVAYGGQWALLPTGSITVEDLPLRELTHVLGDAEVRAVLIDKAKGLAHLGGSGFPSGSSPLSPFLAMQLVWLVVVGTLIWRAIRHRLVGGSWQRNATWLIWPFAFAASHVSYDIWIYYPRHIVAFNLALALSAALVSVELWPVGSETTRPSPRDHPGERPEPRPETDIEVPQIPPATA